MTAARASAEYRRSAESLHSRGSRETIDVPHGRVATPEERAPAATADEHATGGGVHGSTEPPETQHTGEETASSAQEHGLSPHLGTVDRDSSQRYHRARVSVLQQQVDHYTSLNRDLEARLKEAEVALKSEAEDCKKTHRQAQLLRDKLAKEEDARRRAEEQAESLREELSRLKQDFETASRSARSADNESRNRDVRLNRAVEEARKYRAQYEEERSNKRDEVDQFRQEAKKLESKCTRLERQKSELLSAFRKQLKLIDVLRRQKIHIEAARALAFTEEEFMKTLDWGAT